MRRLVLLVALLIAVPVLAQEAVTLTTPITKPSITTYQVATVLIDLQRSAIVATLTGSNGETLVKTYDAGTTPTGATLLHSLNIGNFSGATSLIHAVYNRLNTDGIVVGAVSGVPQ